MMGSKAPVEGGIQVSPSIASHPKSALAFSHFHLCSSQRPSTTQGKMVQQPSIHPALPLGSPSTVL